MKKESEPMPQINKILPDKNNHYGVEMKINRKTEAIIDTYKKKDIQPLKGTCQE